MRQHRAVRPALGMPRIDALDPIQKLFGLGIILRVDVVLDQQQEAADMIAVALEGAFQRGQH